MKTLLSVRDLEVSFQLRNQILSVVQNISFDLYEGETLGIVGESGCGKSVMTRALIRLLPSHAALIKGTVLYQNRNLLHLTEKELQSVRGKEIGMIFQDPTTSLNPTMKIGYQIAENYLQHHPSTRADAYKNAIELLELVGISEPEQHFEAFPHVLSGGMRQRIMIAIALAARPRLIIADEPTTALDMTIQAQILELLRTIQKKLGTSFLFITHDLSVVAGFCDRVLIMYAGKIVEEASVDDLFAHPSHPYTRGLLNAIPRLDTPSDHPLQLIEGSPPSFLEKIPGCSFCPRCPHAMNICAKQSPQFLSIGPSHRVACWQKETHD